MKSWYVFCILFLFRLTDCLLLIPDSLFHHLYEMESNCFRVHHCSVCSGDTNSFCTSCQCDLCHECKEDHVNHLLTIDHNVVIYHEKLNFLPNQNISKPHSDNVYGDNLQLSAHSDEACEKIWVCCQSSDCSICKKKKTHRQLYVKTASDTKRQVYNGIINVIRSEILFSRSVLLTGIKSDIEK